MAAHFGVFGIAWYHLSIYYLPTATTTGRCGRRCLDTVASLLAPYLLVHLPRTVNSRSGPQSAFATAVRQSAAILAHLSVFGLAVARFGLGLFGCPFWSWPVGLSVLVLAGWVVRFGLGLVGCPFWSWPVRFGLGLFGFLAAESCVLSHIILLINAAV